APKGFSFQRLCEPIPLARLRLRGRLENPVLNDAMHGGTNTGDHRCVSWIGYRREYTFDPRVKRAAQLHLHEVRYFEPETGWLEIIIRHESVNRDHYHVSIS